MIKGFTLLIVIFFALPFSASGEELTVNEMLSEMENLANEIVDILEEHKEWEYSKLEKTREIRKTEREKIPFFKKTEMIVKNIAPDRQLENLTESMKSTSHYIIKSTTDTAQDQQEIIWKIQKFLNIIAPYEILPIVLRNLLEVNYLTKEYLKPLLKEELKALRKSRKKVDKYKELRKKFSALYYCLRFNGSGGEPLKITSPSACF